MLYPSRSLYPTDIMNTKIIAIVAVVAIIIIGIGVYVAFNGNGGSDKESITLDTDDMTLGVGDSAPLSIKVTPSTMEGQVEVIPSDSDVFSYEDGTVKGLKKGQSTITVKLGDLTNTINVNITGIRVTDHTGKVLELDKPAERVVVYTKYTAEAFVVMGATDKVVATSKTVKSDSNLGKYFENAADAGDVKPTSPDAALANNADLVIIYDSDATIFEQSGIPVLSIGASKMDEIHNDIAVLGKVLGMNESAKKVLAWFDKYHDILEKESVKTDKSIRNAIEASLTKFGMVGDTGSAGAVLALAGGSNLYKGGNNYVDQSTLIEQNPQYYFAMMLNKNWNETGIQNKFSDIQNRLGWDAIDAVKNKNVYVVSNDLVGGLRSIIGAMFFLSVLNDGIDYDVVQMGNEYNALGNTDFNVNMVYRMQ